MKIDYSKIEKAPAVPKASSMIETFRAIGYSIETAIADIIDNSIAAKAQNIWIDYNWKGPNTTISISDDGHGMNNQKLIQALKPGSTNPLDERDINDLGRFGLGLKTASFSQCRKFAVLSKTEGTEVSFWCWDLDYIKTAKSWTLLKYCPEEETYIQNLISQDSGTTVVWWGIDRLTAETQIDNEKSKAKFLVTMDSVKKHLGMVFHRFIEGGINLYFRNRMIKPWDPFMVGFDGLQPKPETILENGKIRIKGFVLPHRSKLTTEKYNYGKGPQDSWTTHQGFYVYRNKRLLMPGDWLGMFKKEVHYDLCRILIDLPNSMDDEWQIDIKKSVARPPAKLKEIIYSIAKEIRAQALQVYRHKGKVVKRKLAKDEYFPFWEERTRHGKRFYKINRNHPIIKKFMIDTDGYSLQIEKMLQFIEETIPVPLITLQENENETPHGQPFEGKDHEAIHKTMLAMYKNMINEGKTREQATALILNIEPFNFYPEYLDHIR